MVLAFVGACSSDDPAARSGDADEASAEQPTSTPVASLELGELGAPQPVLPAPGSVLEGIDRDAGVSVGLRDGSTMWFFGDTASFGFDGELRYFEVGSAAWSPPGQPSVTLDYARGDQPVPFARPGDDFPACPPESENSGMWPTAAVVEPVGERDRIIVWMANICLGPGPVAVGRGMSVGEVWYDPAQPPAYRPVDVTVLEPVLFAESRLGSAALLDTDGWIYTYGCGVPESPGDADEYGPCTAARVQPAEVASADAYEHWDGDGWAAGAEPAALELQSADAEDPSFAPVGTFAVTRPVGSDLYVMGYSPWPGYSNEFELRVAHSPQGPWSAPSRGIFPNCADEVGDKVGRCYAANLQPHLDAPGVIGVGWYDQVVTTDPPRGAFYTATVPYELPAG